MVTQSGATRTAQRSFRPDSIATVLPFVSRPLPQRILWRKSAPQDRLTPRPAEMVLTRERAYTCRTTARDLNAKGNKVSIESADTPNELLSTSEKWDMDLWQHQIISLGREQYSCKTHSTILLRSRNFTARALLGYIVRQYSYCIFPASKPPPPKDSLIDFWISRASEQLRRPERERE